MPEFDCSRDKEPVGDSVVVTVGAAVTVNVAIVAETVRVEPAGAQNGPLLGVERCVPTSDENGELVAKDPVAVLDGRPVTTVPESVTDGQALEERVWLAAADEQPDTLAVRDTEGDRDRETTALSDRDSVLVGDGAFDALGQLDAEVDFDAAQDEDGALGAADTDTVREAEAHDEEERVAAALSVH